MNTTLTLILAVVCIIVATVLRNLVEKNLRRTAEENPEKYQKKLRNINIIRLVLTIGHHRLLHDKPDKRLANGRQELFQSGIDNNHDCRFHLGFQEKI